MNNSKYILKWKKQRQRGIVLYILQWLFLIPSSGFIGKVIGHYFVEGDIDMSITVIDIYSLVILSILGICLGLFTWNRNIKKFSALNEEIK